MVYIAYSQKQTAKSDGKRTNSQNGTTTYQLSKSTRPGHGDHQTHGEGANGTAPRYTYRRRGYTGCRNRHELTVLTEERKRWKHGK